MPTPTYQDIEFTTTDGTVLRGRFYAATAVPGPVVVMAHGFAGTIDLRLSAFAENFAGAGLNVLVHDHRGFGTSDGVVRQEVDPYVQMNDWRDAITFAQTRPEVDPDRVGIWGTSYAGGQALVLGATDRRVRAVVSQVPFISGAAMADRQPPGSHEQMQAALTGDRLSRMAGGQPAMVPVVVEHPTQPAALPTPDAWEFTQQIIDSAPTWRNEVTLRSLELSSAFEPGGYVARISPTPLLMVVGTGDVVTPPGLALATYAAALEPKQLVLLDGGHFDPYLRRFDEAAEPAARFFTRYL